MKLCRWCHIEKDQQDFYKKHDTKCKACKSEYYYQKKNKNNKIIDLEVNQVWSYFNKGTQQRVHDWIEEYIIPYLKEKKKYHDFLKKYKQKNTNL